MYGALHQRTIKIEIITGETKFSIWYQHKKNKSSHSNYKSVGIELQHSESKSATLTGVIKRVFGTSAVEEPRTV
jgi:hypothetical protein